MDLCSIHTKKLPTSMNVCISGIRKNAKTIMNYDERKMKQRIE